MDLIIDFDLNKLDKNKRIFISVVHSIIYMDDSEIDVTIGDIVEEENIIGEELEINRYHGLIEMALNCIEDLTPICGTHLRYYLGSGYDITNVYSLGKDTVVTLTKNFDDYNVFK